MAPSRAGVFDQLKRLQVLRRKIFLQAWSVPAAAGWCEVEAVLAAAACVGPAIFYFAACLE